MPARTAGSGSRGGHQACDELLAYEPFLAGEAFYVAGEVRRRMGDHDGAAAAFTRAHELGREPQPGLALVRLGEGRTEAAGAALQLSPAEEGSRLGRVWLLAAQVEVTLAGADIPAATSACAELEALARDSGSDLVWASAATACGALRLAEDDTAAAFAELRRACSLWQRLELPYETARTRLLLADACRRAGDRERERLELGAARSAFEWLGAVAAADVAAARLAEDGRPPCGLTRREVGVLRLVAAGTSNRGIAAELVISEHTVARHLSNIFRKIGVSSRSAATAFAYEHGLA